MIQESLPEFPQPSPDSDGGPEHLTPVQARAAYGSRIARTLEFEGETGTDVTDRDWSACEDDGAGTHEDWADK